MALALYRKYRPATFADLVGQGHVTEPLMQALSNGRINHAYLFSGPRGCGKTSSARILARSLNCVDGPTPTPCGKCDSCVALAPDGPGSLDVIEIDAASHGGVDDARDLRERAFFAPVSSRYKVYIVDEAHMVSTQGFNALLKLVEEPPEFLVFIFATTEPDKVLQTIRSRTHHYPFRLLPPGTMRGLLEQVCTAESVQVEPPVLPLVVRAGGGSARDSLSVLDQLLAGAGPEGITYGRAVALLGVTDAALLDDMIAALAALDRASVFQAVDRVVEAGHDPRRFAADLLDRLRDLVLLDSVPDAVAKGLLDGPADQLERMTDQASSLGTATLSRLADVVHAGLTEMRGTTAPRLLLELVCARMLLPGASSDLGALLQRVERLERRQSIAPPADGAPSRSATPAESSSGRSATPPATGKPQSPPAAPPRAATPASAPSSSAASAPSSPAATPPPASPAPVAPTPTASAPERTASTPTPTASAPERTASAPTPTASAPERTASAPTPTASAPERTASAPTPTASAPERTAPEPTAVAEQPSAPPAGGIDVAAVRQIWPEVLEVVKRQSRRTHALLLTATVATLEGDRLALTIGSAPLARLLSEASNVSVIRSALQEVLGVEWQVSTTPDGDGGGSGSGGGQQPGPPPQPPRGPATAAAQSPRGAVTSSVPQRVADPGPNGPGAVRGGTGQAARESAAPAALREGTRRPGSNGANPAQDEPPPDLDEPDPRDDPYASEVVDAGPPPLAKPSSEAVAISLLQTTLGARTLD